MMTLKVRDLVATVLVVAIAIPYVGYLMRGEMPFIEDPRGMAATGLILGAAAYLMTTWGEPFDETGSARKELAVVSLTLGFVALAFAETAAAGALLALFMISIAAVWLVKLVDHDELPRWHTPTGAAH